MRSFSLNCVLIFFLQFVPGVALAHDEVDQKEIEALASLMLEIANLSSHIANEDPDVSQALVKIGNHYVHLNGPFWQLVRGWIRVYYQEIQKDCDRCFQFSEEQFNQLAEDHIAKTAFDTKIKMPLMESIEHISIGTAGLGARLGKVALVAKATSEVAETVLSKMMGGGGVHIVCNLIDAMIIFGSRHMQSASRIFSWSPRYEASRMGSLIRMGFVSASVRRAQSRATFVTGPVEVDPSALKEVDLEGPNRWWGWANEGKRAKWVKKIVKRGQANLKKSNAMGARMKRYLLLKGRKRGHSSFLRGTSVMDNILSDQVLWVLAIQENILQRSLLKVENTVAKPIQPAPKKLTELYAQPFDEVRQGLAEEFDSRNYKQVEELLKEVEIIFNPKAPMRIRYLQATMFESLFSGFVFGVFNQVLHEKGEVYRSSFSGIWRQSVLNWDFGRFAGYIYEWSDFLRLSSLQSNPEKLEKHKYESMESLLRLYRYLQKITVLTQARSVADLVQIQQQSKDGYHQLMTFRPWKEKVIVSKWFPWSEEVSCQKMNEIAP